MQHMVLSLSKQVSGRVLLNTLCHKPVRRPTNNLLLTVSSHSSCVSTGHHELSQRVTEPYAACIQLYPPEDEHLRLETCRGEQYVCMYVYIGYKTFFYAVRHHDSIASYLLTGLQLGFFRSWPSLFLPNSFSSVFLVLSFVSASTSMLFGQSFFCHSLNMAIPCELVQFNPFYNYLEENSIL